MGAEGCKAMQEDAEAVLWAVKPCRGMHHAGRPPARSMLSHQQHTAKAGFDPGTKNRALAVAARSLPVSQSPGTTPGRAGQQPPPWLQDGSSRGTMSGGSREPRTVLGGCW